MDVRRHSGFGRRIDPLPTQPPSLPQHQTNRFSMGSDSLNFIYTLDSEEKSSTHFVIENGAELRLQIERLHVEDMNSLLKPAFFIGSGVRLDPNEDAERYGQLDVRGEAGEVLKVLKLIEPDLQSLTSIAHGNSSLVYADIKLSRKIPVAYMGEGIARLLSFVLAIATTKNGVVLIDEIENGWHYSVLSKVWQAIAEISRKFNCQIIATTHSYEAVKYLKEGLAVSEHQDYAYIRLDKEQDRIVPKVYEAEMLTAAMEREWEVR